MRNRTPSARKCLLALCLAAALVFPAAASASFQAGDSPHLAVRHENGPAVSVAPASIPAPDTTDGGSGNTLPMVLAGAALGITLLGTSYVVLRLRSLPARKRA